MQAAEILQLPVWRCSVSSDYIGPDQSGHLFLQENGIEDWSGVAAVLCGQKGMCEAITELLTSKGVPKESILLNF